MKIQAIVLNTLKEATRNKVFYLLIAVGLFFAISSRLISLLTIGDKTRIIYDLGLASINFFSVLVAIFTGINLIFKEIDKKTIFNILSKPISRVDFIIGKFLGLAYTLLIALGSMAIIFAIFLFITVGSVNSKIILYFVLMYFELLIITALALLFSSFSSPILSSIFTICLYLIGQVTWTFNLFKDKVSDIFSKTIAYLFYYLLPNLSKFNMKNMLVLDNPINYYEYLLTLGYGVFYVSALLALTIYIFQKRQFQ
jgi:ABC-type transport system involved in multi-copper enzyme maturation permease subunit